MESDGVNEMFERELRSALTLAVRVAEMATRARQGLAVREQARSEARTEEMARRMDAERMMMRDQTQFVDNPTWWDRANPDEIAEMYAAVRTWSELDPEAARREALMAEECQRRYGVDPQAVNAGLDRDLARAERSRANAEEAEAAALANAAQRADHEAERAAESDPIDPDGEQLANDPTVTEPAPAAAAERDSLEDQAGDVYDSAERRAATAADLEARIDNPAAVEARMAADTAQAKPVAEATRTGRTSAPKARRSRGSGGRARQQQRGMSR